MFDETKKSLAQQAEHYAKVEHEALKLQKYFSNIIKESEIYIADPILPLWTYFALKGVTIKDLKTKYKNLPIQWIIALIK